MTQDFESFLAIASGRAFKEHGRGANNTDAVRHALRMLFERVVILEKSMMPKRESVVASEGISAALPEAADGRTR